MLFKDFLTPERILGDLGATTKSEAITELAESFFLNGTINPGLREGVLAALFHREEIQSTALGQGFGMAIPHAKHPGVRGLVGVFGRSREGVDFASPDGQPVHLFFMLLSNRESANRHLEALAYISRKFRNREFRNCLLRAVNQAQIADFLEDSDNEE
ncbi:MAG: PTS sugar transporter subunit IIA [Planctomycetota bacterium]|jgi:PTS system fructose-specific IIA component/PTS system nitrogen regulatory IIA component|nr:PTS sugar transporter subunit IIA [Planctomycetota bacterium]